MTVFFNFCNKTTLSVQICYGRRKSNYFHFMEANRLLLSLYGVEEEKIKFFRNPLYKSAFAGQYYVKEIKSFSILGH